MGALNLVFRLLVRRNPFYVVSHERSGTHLTINTLFRNTYVQPCLHYVGDWLGPYDAPSARYAHLETFARDWPTLSSRGGIIKTHADAELFHKRYPKADVVYVLRDPRDTMVSLFHYLNSDDLHRTNPGLASQRCADFGEFLRRPASDYLRLGFYENPDFEDVAGRWAQHVSGWLSIPGICVVRYEEFKKDFRKTVNRVCRSIGIVPRLLQAPVGLYDAPAILPRQGASGGWRDYFSDDDEQFLQKRIAERGLDLKISAANSEA